MFLADDRMASFSRSTFTLLISLTLLLHSQTLPKTAFSHNLIFHFPPFFNKNLVLLGSSSLRDGSLWLTENNDSPPSSSFGAAMFLHPVAITPLVSFSTSFSFLVTNPDQDPDSSGSNAITFFLLPNRSALFHSPHAVKNKSIFFLEFPISQYRKAENVSLITARISIQYKKGGMVVSVSAGEPRFTIKEDRHVFLSKHFVEHIYAGFLSSKKNSSESHVIKSWNLFCSIFHLNNPQSIWRITLQSKKALKHYPSISLDILIRATILATAAAVIIIACFNVKEQCNLDAVAWLRKNCGTRAYDSSREVKGKRKFWFSVACDEEKGCVEGFGRL